jgi:hypothetical protein
VESDTVALANVATQGDGGFGLVSQRVARKASGAANTAASHVAGVVRRARAAAAVEAWPPGARSSATAGWTGRD